MRGKGYVHSYSKIPLMFAKPLHISCTRLKSPDPVRSTEANSSMERHCEALNCLGLGTISSSPT